VEYIDNKNGRENLADVNGETDFKKFLFHVIKQKQK